MRRRVWATLVVVLLLFLTTSPSLSQGRFRVIVNASNSITSLARDEVGAYFLRKKKTWQDGQGVQPVDQSTASDVRQEFSKAIHGRSATAIKSYWQRMIFSGRGVPPPEKGSDQEVLSFVARNRGAIGYVDADIPLVNGVREISVQ